VQIVTVGDNRNCGWWPPVGRSAYWPSAVAN